MLESLLRIRNFYWAEERFRPPLGADSPAGPAAALATLRGQFAIACAGPNSKLILARDSLGINKLFFTVLDSAVVVANYLIDLVDHHVPFEAIYSVPAGHFVEIDVERRTLCLRRYFDVAAPRPEPSLPRAARNIREQLNLWFSRLAEQFRHRKICVTLSGGLDSSLIAALTAKCFPNATAYTYGYVNPDGHESEDVSFARHVADFLDLPLRIVYATSDDVLGVLEDALCYGQDWRDFNAHCAIVNEILARAIERDLQEVAGDEPPLVFTGDLANELLADYAPLFYAGQEIYKLPKVAPERLRTTLLQGLDAGDREVGVFGHHGMDVIQPYGLVIDQYLNLPGSSIGGETLKQSLVRTMAADLLPSFLFQRRKAKAQIGDPVGPGGIISTLLGAGYDARQLKRVFARRFMVKEETCLNGFIWLGRYRFLREFPHETVASNDAHAR